MNFAPLIDRTLAAAGRDLSLSELLELVDRLHRSVPTLEELNAALQSLGRPPVTAEAYDNAVSENHEMAVQWLERQGISRERQQEMLQRYPEHDVPFLASMAANLALPCNLALLIWGVRTLLKPGGPRGEELVIVYWWVVPLVMAIPAWVAIHSWLNHWALSNSQLIFRNAPFALAIVVWAWIALLPT